MKLLLAMLIVGILSAEAAMAKSKNDWTPEDSPFRKSGLYALVVSNIESVKEKMEHSPDKNKLLKFVFNLSGAEIADHYLGMFNFFADNMRSDYNDVGGGNSGYHPIRTYISVEDLEKMKTQLIDNSFILDLGADSRTDLAWQEWVDRGFGGDKMIAMKAIPLLISWTYYALNSSITDKNLLSEVIHLLKRGCGTCDGYSVAPLPSNAFDLNLFGVDNNSWGKAYKVIAGINLQMAALNEGYSEKDSLMAVAKAGLLYESSDFLYDHVGLKRTDISQAPDHPSNLQVEYGLFKDRVLIELARNSKLKGQLLASVLGIKELAPFISESISLDLNDDLIITYLLYNFAYEFPKDFKATIAPLFFDGKKSGSGDSHKLFQVFNSGIKDVGFIMEGARFVSKELDPADFKKSNINYSEKPFKGIQEYRTRLNIGLLLLNNFF